MAYSFLRVITIDHTKVGGDLTSYPVLINSTLTYLKTVANGGSVQNASGYDIVFVTDPNDETTLLNWEVEKYDATTGLIIAWVKVPALSATVDTTIYLLYGNASVSTFQGNVVNTWPSGFKGVYHMPGNELGIIAPDLSDSTSNNNDGSATGVANETSVPTQIGGGCFFTGGGSGVDCGVAASLELQDFSVSGWMTPTSIGSFGFSINLAAKSAPANEGTTSGWAIIANSDFRIRFQYYDGAARQYFSTVTIANSTLYFFTFVRNQATGQFLIYINGALADTVIANTGTIQYAGDTFYFGGPGGGAISVFAGKQDEVRIYSGVQSAAWVLTDYNNQFSPSTFYTVSSVSTPFVASCGSPPDGVAGALYTHTFPQPVSGGLPPFFFALLTRAHESFTPEDVLNNITLDGGTGVWSGYPAVPGTYQFTLDVFDAASREEFVDCHINITDGVPPSPPLDWLPVPPVNLPFGWDFASGCARTGDTGLSHVADGTAAGSNAKVVSQTPIDVEAGWVMYVSLWAKWAGGE